MNYPKVSSLVDYNLILNLCTSSIKNRKFVINGNNYKTKDGTPIRDYIHVEDLAKIILVSIQNHVAKRIINATDQKNITTYDAIDYVTGELGLTSQYQSIIRKLLFRKWLENFSHLLKR